MEKVGITESGGQSLPSSEGEARHGPMVRIPKHTVIGLGERYYFVNYLPDHNLGIHRVIHRLTSAGGHLGKRIGIGHNYYHPFRFSGGYQIIHNDIDLPYLEPGLVSVGHPVDKIEHGEFLPSAGDISRRSIDTQGTVESQTGRVIPAV